MCVQDNLVKNGYFDEIRFIPFWYTKLIGKWDRCMTSTDYTNNYKMVMPDRNQCYMAYSDSVHFYTYVSIHDNRVGSGFYSKELGISKSFR